MDPQIISPEGSEMSDEQQWQEFLDSKAGEEFIETVPDQIVGTDEYTAIEGLVLDFMAMRPSWPGPRWPLRPRSSVPKPGLP